jgi:hypothetical protein
MMDLTRLEGIRNSYGILWCQVLIVVVAVALGTVAEIRDNDHWSIDAGAHALHLAQRECPAGSRLAKMDAKVLL